MSKKMLLESRPNYHHGQLLLEDDFLDEQRFHLEARRRHNLGLHGWGVVRGLEVAVAGRTVTVQPGLAIDRQGRDILLQEPVSLELSGFGPHELVKVGLSYQEEPEGTEDKRRACYAVLSLSPADEEDTALVLAMAPLDNTGQPQAGEQDYSKTVYAGTVLGHGSVSASELAPELRTGWLRMPFRPIPLANLPTGEKEIPPAFRVGATEARSPSPAEGEHDKGAAGTMAIPIPPSVRHATRFRIAGSVNEGHIEILLVVGGWSPEKDDHYRRTLVEDTLTQAPFLETYAIESNAIDPEFNTLSLWIRSSKKASISLVAVEFAY
jgi:hypothetical protein